SVSRMPTAAASRAAASACATTRPASRMASSAASVLSSTMPCYPSPWLLHALTTPSPQLLLGPAAEVAGEESFRRRVEAQPVLGLGEPVALVGEEHVLVVDSGLAQGGHDLLRLRLLHPRVVGALGDQQRGPDARRPGPLGAGPEED